jgi:hypothetical protein
MIMCGLKPIILLINSVLKPPITDITIIKTETPKAIPPNEKTDIIFKKPSFFLGLRYRKAILSSKEDINLNFFFNKFFLNFF